MGLLDLLFEENKKRNDKCIEMLNTATFNPFNLTKENPSHTIPNIEHVFRRELESQLNNALMTQAMGEKNIIKGYVFNLVESYYNNAGYVPSNILDEIIRQVFSALKSIGHSNVFGSYEKLRYEMYYCFLHN